MQLNQYIWNNYKQTKAGEEAIKMFAECNTSTILSKFKDVLPENHVYCQRIVNALINFYNKPALLKITSNAQAKNFIEVIVQQGIGLVYKNNRLDILHFEEFDFLYHISIISLWLYVKNPLFFKPYFFTHKFSLLTKIADTFGLVLLEVPGKRHKEERFKYYQQLCESFSDFQITNDLDAAELCAFLYDFAPNYLKQTDQAVTSLPQATQAWWIGGDKSGADFDFLDTATPESVSSWQGNEDTKRGDILIMYCLAPRSYIHSIWRATADGTADPFFHYYSSIYISHGQKIEPITVHELKTDPHFSKNPLVRRNLQGISGYPLSFDDYARMQEMISQKGGDISKLPQLYGHLVDRNRELKNEREVELHLIEPLLLKLAFEGADWVRQLPIRMGRGERNFPDYVFLTDKTKGYEKAYMLIESKFCIKNNRELEEAFKQAWSYGQRLNAKILVIADKDAIWIYEKQQDTFDRTNYTRFFWQELEMPDTFTILKKLIGKQ